MTAGSISVDEAAVLDLIDPQELRDIAVELVQSAGENPPGLEAASAATLARICRERGFEVSTTEVERDRPNVSATLEGGSGPALLLLGHTDVVPVGNGWTVPAFGGQIHQGRLTGRGSADMKGGLAACVVAMAALARSGIRLAGPVELLAAVDEEETGKGIRHYVQSLGPSAARRFVGCIVAEPTELQTIIAARGDAYVEVTVTGRAAHSGNPGDGRNAIQGAARVIAEIEQMHSELSVVRHPLVGPATWSVGQVHGGTGTSTVPAECVVTADRRLLPAEAGPDVLTDFTERLEQLQLDKRGLGVSARMTMDMPGFETAPAHELVTTSSRAVLDAGGPDLPLAGWTAACDGGFLARDVALPVIVLGPGSVATKLTGRTSPSPWTSFSSRPAPMPCAPFDSWAGNPPQRRSTTEHGPQRSSSALIG